MGQLISLEQVQLMRILKASIVELESLKVQYANCYSPETGLSKQANRIAKTINIILAEGAIYNTQFKALTGEYYDYRFLDPKLYPVVKRKANA